MCGIAGIVGTNQSAASRVEAVERMNSAMLHRGPDEQGVFSCDTAALGNRRLAIFDPSNGHQPMSSADGRHTLVFNGAIYNFEGLRAQLDPPGSRWQTQCDTEVLLAALIRWGEAALPKLRGMFAFSFWDNQTQELLIARDPFGIKPFYYHWGIDGGITFASELEALFASNQIDRKIDPSSINSYLAYFSVPAPKTIYRRVRCLQPGHCARWKAGKLSLNQYWDLQPENIVRNDVCTTYDEFVPKLRSQLEDSVRAHAVSDVRVGAFLSGGLDSSGIAAMLARQSEQKLSTFTLGFGETGFAEQDLARETAQFLGTDHHEFQLTGDEVAKCLPDILARMDQPTGDGINTYFVSRLAAQTGVKVVLSGLGGDEIFGGYPSFSHVPKLIRYLKWWHRLPVSVRKMIITRMRRNGEGRSQKIADLLDHARDLHEIASLQRMVFAQPSRMALLSKDVRASSERKGPFHPLTDDFATELQNTGVLHTVSAWEMRTYMTDVLLSDSDVFSMANSIELRTPFVDSPLVRWLWQQPEEFVYTAGRSKGALADAMKDYLPTSTRERPKVGFTLPFALWMRGPLRDFLENCFSNSSLQNCPWLDARAVRSLWDNYLQHDNERNWSRVWSLAMLVSFANRTPLK